ncbi:hypothetical protein NKH84_05440 [Mesorhizobium sp. M0902]
MAKPLYLVGKPGDQKFKRNIPARLQSVAGQTAFVERVRGKSAAEIRQQGSLFAVMTDAQLQTFEARLASGLGVPSETDAEVSLNATTARQIAVSYFLERHQGNLLRGDYFALQDDPDFPDLLSDAGEAASVALRVASGAEVTTDPKALELLVRHGIVSRAQADRISPDKWPSSLVHHKFYAAS